MLAYCEKHGDYYDLVKGCPDCLAEIARMRLLKLNLIRRTMEDWLSSGELSKYYRRVYYILGEPAPDWLGDFEPEKEPAFMGWLRDEAIKLGESIEILHLNEENKA